MVGWFALLLLLLLRKANRSKKAWALLIPLVMLYLVVGIAERLLNGYLIFHYHQYICSALADLFRFFALSLAILLAFGDRFDIPIRLLRFFVVGLFLYFSTNLQIAVNAWPFLETGKWALAFAFILGVFLLGHAVLKAVVRLLARPARFRWYYSALCLFLGLVPLPMFGMYETYLSQSVQLQSVLEKFRAAVVLASGLSLPYAIYSAFLFLALRNPVYRDRLARVFGVTNLSPAAVTQPEPEADTAAAISPSKL